MATHKKITWAVIFKDFKDRHPRLGVKALRFEPYDYATILIVFPEQIRMLYNYDSKSLELKRT